MRETFCGGYFKCQNGRQTLAVIPAERGLRLTARLREPAGQPLCAPDASFVYEYPR